MRMRQAVLAASFLVLTNAALAGDALADDLPLPATDFQGEWVSATGQTPPMTLHYSAARKMIRMDQSAAGANTGMLNNLETGEMVLWNDRMPGRAMSLTRKNPGMQEGEPTAETRTVNGEACTVWVTKEAKLCLSEDNIVLQSDFEHGSGFMRNLERVAQDADLFSVPDGLKVVPVPAQMQQMMGGTAPQKQ